MHQTRVLSTIFLLAPLVFSFAFAMDIYIPVVPEMKDFFQTSQANIQLTLSLFLFVLGLGQLIMGPITDQYGRRRVVLFSIVLFIIGSFLCAITNSIKLLIVARMIQAFGGCGMMVAAFAMVRDQFSGNEAAKVYSFLNCGIAMSPLFAPIIGSYLAVWFNWRAGFIFLALMGVLILVAALIKIKETHPKENRVKLDMSIFKRYAHILKNPHFLVYMCAVSAGLTMFFTFFSSSPYIVIQLLHVPVEHFGYYFFTVGFTFFIGSLLSGKIADRIGAYKTVLLGTIMFMVAGWSMWLWYEIAGLSTLQFILPCMLAGLSGAFMMGAGVGGAMEPFGAIAGSAAALVGCMEFVVGSVIGSVVMHWPVTSTNPLAFTIGILGTITLIILIGYAIFCGKSKLIAKPNIAENS